MKTRKEHLLNAKGYKVTKQLEALKSPHTPTPWEVITSDRHDIVSIKSSDGSFVVSEMTMKLHPFESAKTNAAYIVRAVNAHEELLEVLKDLLAETALSAEEDEYDMRSDSPRKQAYRLIAKVEASSNGGK